jgi:MFS family permease
VEVSRSAAEAPVFPAPGSPPGEASVLPAPPAAPEEAPRVGTFAPLRYPNFAIFWTGAGVSNAGTWLQNTALSWLVLELTGSPFWVSMVTFAQFFPMLLLGLVGGLAADRLERRRVLLVTQSTMMMAAAALAAVTLTGHASIATLLPIVGISGLATSFNAPAFQALVPDLVPRGLVVDAVSLNSAQMSAARVVGPAFGGLALAAWGAGWVFLANALSFLAVIAALLVIRVPRHESPVSTGARALFGGLRVVSETPAIRSLLGATAIVSTFGAPAAALLPVMARDVLHRSAAGYGGMFTVFGLGSVVGALLTGRIVRRFGMRRSVSGALAMLAASNVALGLSRSVLLSSVVLGVIGAMYTVSVGSTNSGIQTLVPARKRGRVMSIYMMAWAGLYPIGAVVAGAVAQQIGAPQTLVLMAIPLGLAALTLARRSGGLARVTLFT